MTAEQARQLVALGTAKTQLEGLYKKIEWRAADGYRVQHSNTMLIPSDIEELQSKGFVVEVSEPNNCHRISW